MRLIGADDTVVGLAERGESERVGGSAVEDEVDFALGLKKLAESVGRFGGPGIVAVGGGVAAIGGLHGLPCFRADSRVVVAAKLLVHVVDFDFGHRIILAHSGRDAYPASSCGCSREPPIHQDSSHDDDEDDGRKREKPSPILDGMAQNTDKMAAIVIGDDGDERVTRAPADGHYREKLSGGIFRSAGGGEEQARRKWKRNGG